MEYFINDVGQVMKKNTEATFTETTYVGMECQYESMELADRTIYQWKKFNLLQGKYVVDSTNTTHILVNEKSYTPVNGAVQVMKQTIAQPESDEEIANLYEAVIVLDDRITTLENQNSGGAL